MKPINLFSNRFREAAIGFAILQMSDGGIHAGDPVLSIWAAEGYLISSTATVEFGQFFSGPAGVVYGLGLFRDGQIDWQGKSRKSENTDSAGSDLFLTALGRDGQPIWITGPQPGVGSAAAYGGVADDAGLVWITGSFRGTMDLGSGISLQSAPTSGFVAAFGPDGVCHAAGSLGSEGNGLALAPGGGVYFAGHRDEVILADPIAFLGSKAMAARFDEMGRQLWRRDFNGDSDSYGRHAVAGPDGSVDVFGSYSGTLDILGHSITSSGDYDTYLARFDPRGNLVFLKSFGGPGDDGTLDGQRDSHGNLWLTGYFSKSFTFGTLHLTTSADSKTFVAKMDAKGDFSWAVSTSGSGADQGRRLALKPDGGSALVAGVFGDEFQLGGTQLSGQALQNIFLAEIGAQGDFRGATAFGSAGPNEPLGMTLGSDGVLTLAATLGGPIDIDGRTLMPEPPFSTSAILRWTVAVPPSLTLNRPISLSGTDRIGWEVSGSIGRRLSIEQSTDLMHWQKVGEILLKDANQLVEIPKAGPLSGFYRCSYLP